MNVRSIPLKNGEVTAHKRSPWVPLAAVLIGLVLWPLGARFTIDGVLWIGNWILTFLRMPIRIPAPTYVAYLALAPVPLVASFVEWRPLRWRWEDEIRNPYGMTVWIIIVILDAGSTFIGIQNPDPGASRLFIELSQSLALSGILAAVLTFGPEWLLREGWRRLWR